MKYKLTVILIILLTLIYVDLPEAGNILFAAPFFFTARGKENKSQATFNLKIDFTRKERSKDSNWSRTILEIKDRTVIKTVQYGGFRAPEDENRTCSITSDQETRITGYILKQKLNRNIKEKKPCNDTGISVEVKLTAEIDANTYRIEISGMTNCWSGRKRRESNIKNLQLVDDIEFLINSADSKFDSLSDY